jgi:hypothetical protein
MSYNPRSGNTGFPRAGAGGRSPSPPRAMGGGGGRGLTISIPRARASSSPRSASPPRATRAASPPRSIAGGGGGPRSRSPPRATRAASPPRSIAGGGGGPRSRSPPRATRAGSPLHPSIAQQQTEISLYGNRVRRYIAESIASGVGIPTVSALNIWHRETHHPPTATGTVDPAALLALAHRFAHFARSRLRPRDVLPSFEAYQGYHDRVYGSLIRQNPGTPRSRSPTLTAAGGGGTRSPRQTSTAARSRSPVRRDSRTTSGSSTRGSARSRSPPRQSSGRMTFSQS